MDYAVPEPYDGRERDSPHSESIAESGIRNQETSVLLPATKQKHGTCIRYRSVGTNATISHGCASQIPGDVKSADGLLSKRQSDLYPDSAPKTCSRCRHLVKNGINIHSTLAYSRCRCHRTFQSRLQQHHLQAPRANTVVRGGLPSNPSSERQLSSVKVTSATCTAMNVSSTCKPVLQGLPKVVLLPPIIKPSDLTPANVQEAVSPVSSKVVQMVHQTSPEHSTPRLPTLSCASVYSKEKQSLSTNITPSSPQVLSCVSSSMSMNHLADMIHYILPMKKQQLKSVFKVLDKDEDGHLSCAEFLGSLPFGKLSGDIHVMLTELYKAMSDATYFGQREFIVSYCIAEVLMDSTMIAQFSMELNKIFIHEVLTPYMSLLSLHVVNERVFSKDIKVVVSKMNDDWRIPFSLSVDANRLEKVFKGRTLHFVDCVALAPFYINMCKSF